VEIDFPKLQEDRHQRDIVGRTEEYHSEFVDTQLEAARKYIEQQLAKPETGSEPAPAAEQAQPAPKPEEKKAAGRLRLFPIPLGRAA
jgi:hypothetical protein